MIDVEEALAIAQSEVAERSGFDPERFVVLEEHTMERPYGWVFYYQSRRYMESGNISEMLAGNVPFLVKKENGEIVTLGYDVERLLKGYEAGYRSHTGDLTVMSASNIKQSALILNRLRLTYVIPEIACGVEWRIAKYYTLKQLETILMSPPAKFERIALLNNYEILMELRASKYCHVKIECIDDEQ